MSNIRLKLKAITPIHIGSGEIYEPTNFIIDNRVLYEFRDEDFFEALPDIKRQKFMQIVSDNVEDSFARIHKFVKENRDFAKKIAHIKVSVTKGIEQEYNKVVGRVRQYEGKAGNYSRVFNRFEIQRIQRKQIKSKNGYSYLGYIVGSSLKGAISTAYQESIFKKEGEKALKNRFQAIGRDIHKNIFKEFKVSDSIVTKIGTRVGFALNKERFDYDFNNPQNNIKLSTYIEVINPTSEFIVDINYGSLDIKEILQSCNDHYMPIFKSILSNETDGKEEFTNEYLTDKFYQEYRYFELKPNQYIIRVGKHSGARAVTIDGLRKIKSKLSGGGKRRKPNKWETREDETTTWFFGESPNLNSGLLPFGWVIIEVVSR
jgi:CRISPR-associated protein Csm5